MVDYRLNPSALRRRQVFPFYCMHTFIFFLLGVTSVISLAFIIERGLRPASPLHHPPAADRQPGALSDAQRCEHPAAVLPATRTHTAVAPDHGRHRAPRVGQAGQRRGTADPRPARGQPMERGLVVLEIITGIAPLMGLVGTVYGLIDIFRHHDLGLCQDVRFCTAAFPRPFTPHSAGLSIAIPSLVAWSIYT